MTSALLYIAAGIPVGFFFRNNAQVQKYTSRVLTITVWLLLFFLGLSTGADKNITSQLGKFGIQAFLISTFSLLGSVSFAYIIGRRYFPDFKSLKSKEGDGGKKGFSFSSMKNSAIILLIFFTGIILAFMQLIPESISKSNMSSFILYILFVAAGMGVGFDLKAFRIIRELKGIIFLVPLGVVVGTLIGSSVAWLFLSDISLTHALAVGCGFGYYSLATVIMTELGNPMLGSVALLSNMIHEILTLVLAPFLVSYFGRLAPVMSGGAAAMDTCLPVIVKNSGERYAIIAVFSGMVLTITVPILVPLLMKI